MPTASSQLADRVRALLPARPVPREVPMFGGLSFMVNEKIVVSLRGDGDLMVRVDPERGRELVGVHGAQRAEMGTGRSMGPGWISIAAGALATDEGLSFWVAEALEYNAREAGSGGEPPSTN